MKKISVRITEYASNLNGCEGTFVSSFTWEDPMTEPRELVQFAVVSVDTEPDGSFHPNEPSFHIVPFNSLVFEDPDRDRHGLTKADWQRG